MGNKEKIDYLLSDIKELEKLIVGMRDAEVYPVSFFSQTFDLTHKILNDLHELESDQIETLRKQMEEHQALIHSIPRSTAKPLPIIPEIAKQEDTEEQVKIENIHITKNIQEESPQEEIRKEEAINEPPAVKSIQPSGITEKHMVSLHEALEKQNLSDLRKAFSLNDRFYFRKELFNNDEAKMNKVISDLNEIHSYEESITYLNEKFNWDMEDTTVNEFTKLLEKRFL